MRRGDSRWIRPKRHGIVGLLLTVVVLTGCSPNNQAKVVSDPSSGEPMLLVALCDGEQIQAAQLAIPNAPVGYGVFWRIERQDPETPLDQVVLGQVPTGFAETIAFDSAFDSSLTQSRELEFTAELRGGAAMEAGTRFRWNALREPTDDDLSTLRAAAEHNCGQIPYSLPPVINALAPVALLGLVAATARTRAPRRPQPRNGRRSTWRWSFGGAVIITYVLAFPWEEGSRSEPLRFLGLGSAVGLLLIATAFGGRRLRGADPPRLGIEGLLVITATFLVALPATLVFGTYEGLLTCGEKWTFDCSPSWWDRLALLAPLTVAWIAAVIIGEGGWWLTIKHRPDGSTVPTSGPPLRRGIALGALLLLGLVAQMRMDSSPAAPRLTLTEAADMCETDLARELISAGSDPNSSSPLLSTSDVMTPLEAAVRYCEADLVETLIDAGASVNPETGSPLVTAFRFGNDAAFETLLAAGADPNQDVDDHLSVLAAAARAGDTRRVNALIAAGAIVDISSGSHRPLFQAVIAGQVDTAASLLSAGADPNAPGELDWFDLLVYLATQDPIQQEVLVKQLGPALGLDPYVAASVRASDRFNIFELLELLPEPRAIAGSFPPLYVAAATGNRDLVELLLAAGANPMIGSQPSGHLPVQAAAILGHHDVVALLNASTR
jgi:ankyrin repeat protein